MMYIKKKKRRRWSEAIILFSHFYLCALNYLFALLTLYQSGVLIGHLYNRRPWAGHCRYGVLATLSGTSFQVGSLN